MDAPGGEEHSAASEPDTSGPPGREPRPNPWAVEDQSGRLLGTRHPWVPIGLGVVLATGGVVVITSSVGDQYSPGFRIAMVGLFIALGLLAAWPGLWSRRHRAEAARGADRNWRKQVDDIREHPVMAFVVLPLMGGLLVSLRAGRIWRHPTATDFLLLGAGGAVLAVLLQGGIALWARHHPPRMRP